MLYRIFLCATLLALAGCASMPQITTTPATKAASAPVCDKLDNMLRELSKEARYAYTADAIDTREGVHMWFVNPKTHAWKQIRVYNNLRACVENEGSDWHWAINH
ncbi:MAG: hypothetical protein ACAH83_02135 [Alphaproteobacteria bacterium]